MKIKLICLYICLMAVLSLLVLGCKSSLQTIQPFSSTCAADDQVVTRESKVVNQSALQFVQSALGPDPSTAYVSFTSEARENVPSEKFASAFQNGIKPMGPYKDLRVAHTYIAKLTGGSQEERVVCGNLSAPESWVAVTAKPGPAEAHVIVEGQTVNNTAVFVVWLIPEQGTWHVQYIHYAIAAIVAKSAEDLQKMADLESQKQHDFNAFILYAAALQLADRGPFFQLGIRPEIEKKMREIKKPEFFEGQPPFTWKYEKSTFKVLNVGPIGVGGKIYLLIDHEIESWADEKEADQKNRDTIAAFAAAYPEFRDVFAGLVVRAHERVGTRLFGTVDENQKQSK